MSVSTPPGAPPIARAERLAALAAAEGLGQLLVGDLVRPGDSPPADLVNVRYLTGFSGTSAACLVSKDGLVFITDFRYIERAERTLPDAWERVRAEQQLIPAVAERLRGRVGFDDAHTSVRVMRRLEELVPDGAELVPAAGLVERLRRQKDEREVEAMAAAARLADEVYERVVELGLAGRTEREVAFAAAARMYELGSSPAFPIIVASGPNGSLPHWEPGDREIEPGELVVVDMGATVDGYCSDCTRTFAVGEAGEEEREVYELVLGAQAAAHEAIRAGAGGRAVDGEARRLIDEAGHKDHFGHGTGHGVGLEVHEAPRLSTRSEDELRTGDAVTVEPGVYIPGRFGVRTEDLVIVTDEGSRNLSGFPKDLRVIA